MDGWMDGWMDGIEWDGIGGGESGSITHASAQSVCLGAPNVVVRSSCRKSSKTSRWHHEVAGRVQPACWNSFRSSALPNLIEELGQTSTYSSSVQ